MSADAINSGNRICMGTLAIERDAEGIIYISWAVKADGEGCTRAETQLQQVIIDQCAIRLNGTGANGGQAIRETVEQSLQNISWEQKRFAAVQDNGKRVLLVFIQPCQLPKYIQGWTRRLRQPVNAQIAVR